MNSAVVPLSNLPSQFAGKNGKFNWWGFTIVALSVSVMTFQIIDICRGWKLAKKEKEQENKIDKLQTEITELKTLHQKYMPSASEHNGSKETQTFTPETPIKNNPFRTPIIRYKGFS